MAAASQQVLHIAGWSTCGFYRRAASVLSSISILFPSRIKVVEHAFPDRTSYRAWLIDGGFRLKFGDSSSSSSSRAKDHSSSPFVWFSTTATDEPDETDIVAYLGGHDDTLQWCRSFLQPPEILKDKNEKDDHHDVATTTVTMMVDDGHVPNHGYDYDLCVIGGGSGGMAAAKEAAGLGAKVVLLDFVKPSPQGTTWGLGGTCVNVGCIPKKLFHASSLFHEGIHADTEAFGIDFSPESTTAAAADNGGYIQLKPPSTQVRWEVLRENIINYIRSLNFKYRVRLREKDVNYLNQLVTFKDAHTIEAADKKGRVTTITASRFLIATGGRPAPLDCEGAELAVSSDDIFSLEQDPGKTLCVGAAYISLECAGFLAGLGYDVTVAVRSILLRGYDRECADMIGNYMEGHGVKFKRDVTPVKMERVEDDDDSNNNSRPQIKVTFSDGSSDVYDTVLGAIGRHADTAKLQLDRVGVQINPKNGKIITKLEQSSCPNIYAVGDVMDGCPEFTPVAIQAGIYLARRLFGGSKEPMDYVNICTTVFTPIEYSCVGLSEDDAIAKYGEDNIEVYHRSFLPLEWTLSHDRSRHNAFAKVVVDKSNKTEQRVLGIHYVGPNAGEVMQGYGAAMKNGLTLKTLTDTVGIHPTCSEEIVTLSITKRSGEDAAAGGC